MPARVASSGHRLCIYGCSFTYGTGLADDETFTALLQALLPDARVHNRGIGGHGTVQNLLQFRTDLREGAVDAAIFAVISDHKYRNIVHPHRMRQVRGPEWHRIGIEHRPTAHRAADGTLAIRYSPFWRPGLMYSDLDGYLPDAEDILPDDYSINSTTFAVLETAKEMAQSHGVPLLIALLDDLDPGFNAGLIQQFPDALDVSTPYDPVHTFLPADIHPNVEANRLFAERLADPAALLCEHDGVAR
ncbi:hypothetical protein HJO_01450 [Hyphomonas johnsonii MHS-2]|uniref:SGNH hydrolase-type esterase domain-containing protein n=1 Tax=Hyphomonas johnsonii MHS-2 TaxID=1280950 RepID=A0A059FTL3_9PROT|nr:hypothetical protein HJO_01450 [Hyphomonas johnsonii MHS-2]